MFIISEYTSIKRCVCMCAHTYIMYVHISKGAQIQGARFPRQLNFVQWHLIFVGAQYGTYCMSPFWHLEFWGGSKIFVTFVHHCIFLIWINKIWYTWCDNLIPRMVSVCRWGVECTQASLDVFQLALTWATDQMSRSFPTSRGSSMCPWYKVGKRWVTRIWSSG